SRTFRHPKPANKARLDILALEGRYCPTVAALSGGILTVTGTDASETIIVQQSGTTITAAGRSFSAGSVASIVVHGLGGDDTIRNNTSKPSSLYGDDGNDVIVGGAGADFLYGGNGADNLSGGVGNDFLYGASGTDGYETGASVNDTLQGGDGADYLYGGY